MSSSSSLRDDLAEAIADRRALILVGAGVSMSATDDATAGWTGLLEDAVGCCEKHGLSAADADTARRLIRSRDLDQMILAAEMVTAKLGGPGDGRYGGWLRESVGRLRPERPEVLEALAALDSPIATTNYDSLLERVTGLRPVTWQRPEIIQMVLRGEDEQRIIHLHGHWEDPETVVLGVRSYDRLSGSTPAQAIESALTVFKRVVFVGCGEGLTDPNFGALRAFLRDAFRSTQHRHFRLCTADEAEQLRERNEHEGEPIDLVAYGENHDDLAPFLRGLRPPHDEAAGATAAPPAPAAEAPAMGTAIGVPALPEDYIDRPGDLDRVREAILGEAEIVGITGLAGPGEVAPEGIGKRTLAAQAATDERVRREFADGVHWVELAAGNVRLAQKGLARQLGLDAAEDDSIGGERLKGALREALRDRRCLIVLDNVPDAGAGQALEVAGRQGRILCTANERFILDTLGAQVVEIAPLSREDAIRLLEKAAGRRGAAGTTWPQGDLDRILAATRGVPNALALVGAAIGPGGRTCAEVADELERGSFLDPDYAVSYAGMKIALDTLSDDDAERCRALAVFPPHEAIPFAALETLWREPGGAEAPVERLARANLVTVTTAAPGAPGAPPPPAISFKHAPLVRLAGSLMERHRALVEAYADRCERPGDGATLPEDEPYIWDHLVHHMIGMGSPQMRAIARDVGFLAKHAHVSGAHAVQRDLARVGEALPKDEAVDWLSRFLETSGHLLAGHPDLASLAASLRLLLLDAPEGVDPGRLEALGLLPKLYLEPKWRRPRLVGDLVREICPDDKDAINGLAFSAEGRLAFGGSGGVVRVWDSERLEQPTAVSAGVGVVGSLAFAREAGTLAVGGDDGSVRLWSTESYTATLLTAHPATALVCSVAFSPDGSLLASCADDGSVRVSDVRGGSTTEVPADGSEQPVVAAFSAAGDLLALGGDAGRVRIWDVAEGRERMARDVCTNAITAIAFSAKGAVLAFGEEYGGVGTWDLADGGEPALIEGSETSVTTVAFSPDGARPRLASGDLDGSVRLWQPDGGGEATIVAHGSSSQTTAVAFSPEGDLLASSDVDGRVRIWDLATTETRRPLEDRIGGISAIAMSLDGRVLATGGDDGRVRVWDARDGGEREAPPASGHDGTIGVLAFSADGEHLAWSGEGHRAVHVWSRNDGRGARSFPSPSSVRAVAAAPDGRRVAGACGDGCVRVWDAAGGPDPRTLAPARKGAALTVTFTEEGRGLLSAGLDGPILRWDLEAGDEGSPLLDPPAPVTALAYAARDGRVAFGCADGRIGLTDADGTGERRLVGHQDGVKVSALAFSGDGSLLASAAADGSAHVTDLSSGELLLQADAGVLGLGLAWSEADPDDWTGSRVALILDGAVLVAEMVDNRR